MKKHVENWAEPLAARLSFPIEASKEMGLLNLDKDLKLSKTPLKAKSHDVYTLNVYQKQNDWPYIQTYQSVTGYQNRFANSVIVLGQHFMNKSRFFAREVPIHILSMRKYFNDTRPYTDLKSTIGAPAFALNESAEIFKELDKEFKEIENEQLDI